MAQSNIDLSNFVAVCTNFIDFLTGPTPAPAPAPPRGPRLPKTLRPPMLREPPLEIRPQPGTGVFLVGKPDFALTTLSIRPDAEFKVIKEFPSRADADAFLRATPRIRMPLMLRYEQKADGTWTVSPPERSPDWRADPDALRTRDRLTEIMTKVPLFASMPDSTVVTLRMALLARDFAQNLPDPEDSARYLVLIDPFKVENGVVELAATYMHELTHIKVARQRGFRAYELAPLLTQKEYLLVTLEEEYACFKNEAESVRQFLASCPADVQAAAKGWIAVSIQAPASVHFSDEFTSLPPSGAEDLIRELISDKYRSGYEEEYQEYRAQDPSTGARAWVATDEWTNIQATLPLWQRAGVL